MLSKISVHRGFKIRWAVNLGLALWTITFEEYIRHYALPGILRGFIKPIKQIYQAQRETKLSEFVVSEALLTSET